MILVTWLMINQRVIKDTRVTTVTNPLIIFHFIISKHKYNITYTSKILFGIVGCIPDIIRSCFKQSPSEVLNPLSCAFSICWG